MPIHLRTPDEEFLLEMGWSLLEGLGDSLVARGRFPLVCAQELTAARKLCEQMSLSTTEDMRMGMTIAAAAAATLAEFVILGCTLMARQTRGSNA